MKSKNSITLFACLVLILTTFINVSIHKKQNSVLGQTTNYCLKIGGYCTNTCSPSSTHKCLPGKWLGCSTTYCAQRITPTVTPTKTYYPTPTLRTATPTNTSPTKTYPTVTPTPKAYYPTPTNIGSTQSSLGYIPCYEIERIYTNSCKSPGLPTSTPITTQYPTKTITPTKAYYPTPTTAPTNAPTRAPTSTPITSLQCEIIANPLFGPAPLKVTLAYSVYNLGQSYVTGIQWDFDGNGSWDTDMSLANGRIERVYEKIGSYNTKMRAQVSDGRTTNPCSIIITVK